MKTRIISAVIAFVIGVLIFVFGEMDSAVITFAAAIISAVMCGEFLSAKSLQKDMKIFIPCVAFAFAIPLLAYSVVGFLPLFLFTLYICTAAVAFNKKVDLSDLLFAFFGVIVLSGSMALFTLRVCAANYHPTLWAILIFCVPWIADSAAYFAGSAFGKKKLCPDISPKKTIEGAVVGVICGALSPFLFALIFIPIYGDLHVNWAILPVIGVVNAILSIIGDLLFSVVKRSCGIKDYGSIMPGHGGLLDRFDSVILCVPVVYFTSTLVTIF